MRPDTTFSGPELCARPAREIVADLRKGALDPADLIEASATRIAQVEDDVNAMVTVCADRNVAGVRTTFGNLAMKDFIAPESEPMVERLESRGGLVMGKTNTPEFGAGGNSKNAVAGPTRNPWDTRMNAGGSSGGAAVSLATGEVWLSQGSDLMGSLRTPAAHCGVLGLRPSPGRCGGGPAVGRGDPHCRRRNLGVLRDGEIQEAEDAAQHGHDGENPGKDRAVNEEARHRFSYRPGCR